MKNLLVLLAFSFINSSLGCSGCLELDELTFGKVLKKFKTVLVKFDQQFPFGDTHEAYAKLAEEINNKTFSGSDHSELITAVVGIKDYGTLDNKKLGEQYGLSKRQDGPIIKIFNDGKLESPIDMEIGKEAVTLNQLYAFIKANSKVHVQVPGCWKDLDELAEVFVYQPIKRKEALKKSEKFIETIECEEKKKLAKTYTVIMKGVLEKGDQYAETQRERMKKLLTDKISEKKIAEINKKLNIIASFRFQQFRDEL